MLWKSQGCSCLCSRSPKVPKVSKTYTKLFVLFNFSFWYSEFMFIKDSNIWMGERDNFVPMKCQVMFYSFLLMGQCQPLFLVFQLLCRLVWNHSNGPRNSLIRIMQKWQRKWLWITLENKLSKKENKNRKCIWTCWGETDYFFHMHDNQLERIKCVREKLQ